MVGKNPNIPADIHSLSSLACLKTADYNPHLDTPSSDIKSEYSFPSPHFNFRHTMWKSFWLVKRHFRVNKIRAEKKHIWCSSVDKANPESQAQIKHLVFTGEPQHCRKVPSILNASLHESFSLRTDPFSTSRLCCANPTQRGENCFQQ